MERKKKTMDGNHAAAHVSYAYTQVAPIYPITPSSGMAELTDEWAASGRKNILNEVVQVREMQSEAGVAGAMHGALAAGALSTTYTASQGLLLMIPNLYKMAGEQLPGVIQVSARTVATHALNIFGDHSDIYACRQTGVAMLCEASVQEVMDLSPVAHLVAICGKIPVINFFDGFRTSHEIQKIDTWDYEQLKELTDEEEIQKFREEALNPNHPCEMGAAQNPDLFFQTREACNMDYQKFPQIVKSYMDKINERLGTSYGLFDYYGSTKAKRVIVAMGSVCETVREVIDYGEKTGEAWGLINVHLYRPFCREAFLAELPESVEDIIVLDRTKEPGAPGEPLYLDILSAIKGSTFGTRRVFHGRYGIGAKDTTPGQIAAVYENKEKEEFTIGILDDVTGLSLMERKTDLKQQGITSCKFWGLGADGTVGANKNSIKIIGDYTNLFVQAYFDYDSKKSGGVTVSHLRFGETPIHAAYLVDRADFVACHCSAYVGKYDMVQDLVEGGSFLLNCNWSEEELDERLPLSVKSYIANHQIHFYLIDATKIAEQIGLGHRVNTILQASFFALTKLMKREEVITLMKEAAAKSYAKKGEEVIAMNEQAIDAGFVAYREIAIPQSWKTFHEAKSSAQIRQKAFCAANNADMGEQAQELDRARREFVQEIQQPVNAKKGDQIPVSVVKKYANGATPSGTATFEKRGVTTQIPVWEKEKCIQCNQCSFVCPHAVIRPFILTAEEVITAQAPVAYVDMKGMEHLKFSIAVSALDCTGCGNCVEVCPAPGKAIVMKSLTEHAGEQSRFDYASAQQDKDATDKFAKATVKGSQFQKPLMEFSGACGGCGETPYVKLLTQLFGERMYISNATGCSSIWGNSSPSTPYTFNREGRGPAWSNSLFEDAAEFGYGMLLAQKAVRENLREKVRALLDDEEKKAQHKDTEEVIKNWLATYEDGEMNWKATGKLMELLHRLEDPKVKEITKNKDFLAKKSQWIIGGDGWAYDIGYGGLDHVLASGEDINILVLDTEVYSNTGGQTSKATPRGASARFCAGGKQTDKKDLAWMAMSYGNVYVAQICMGADKNQCVKALAEAEAYKGPSLVIAYAPCINHGIKRGMEHAQEEERKAVKSGYWINFRYQPGEKAAAKLTVDSKEPDESYLSFLQGENRYQALQKLDPTKAEQLFLTAQKNAQKKLDYLKKFEKLYENVR